MVIIFIIHLKIWGIRQITLNFLLYDGIKGLYKFLVEISGKNDPILIMRTINILMRKIFALDDLDTALSYYRAREVKFVKQKRTIKSS